VALGLKKYNMVLINMYLLVHIRYNTCFLTEYIHELGEISWITLSITTGLVPYYYKVVYSYEYLWFIDLSGNLLYVLFRKKKGSWLILTQARSIGVISEDIHGIILNIARLRITANQRIEISNY
jgi:hypothetical protein